MFYLVSGNPVSWLPDEDGAIVAVTGFGRSVLSREPALTFNAYVDSTPHQITSDTVLQQQRVPILYAMPPNELGGTANAWQTGFRFEIEKGQKIFVAPEDTRNMAILVMEPADDLSADLSRTLS